MAYKNIFSLCIENARKMLDMSYFFYDSFLCYARDLVA